MRWNILNILKEEIYVDLNKDFLKILNSKLKKVNFKMRNFAEHLNVSRPTVNYWFLGINNFPYSSLCFIIKKLRISVSELEKNIEGLSLKSGRTKMFNPKLKIHFDYNFSRFLGHICGDGSLSSKSIISYTNKEDELINDFIELSKKIFGEVECGIYKSKDGTKNIYLPKVIGKFVLKCFPGIRKGYIPRKFFLSNPSTISGFLGAIFDDEGTVSASGRSLRIALANKKLLEDIKFLFEKIDIKTNRIIQGRKRPFLLWNLFIYRRSNFLNFSKKIVLFHIRKSRLLNELIQRYKRKYVDYELKEAVLNKLKLSPMISSQLAASLDTSLTSICKSLTKYHKEGLVRKSSIIQERDNGGNYLINLWVLK